MKTRKLLVLALALLAALVTAAYIGGCSQEQGMLTDSAFENMSMLKEGELTGTPPASYPDAPPIPSVDSTLAERIEGIRKVMGVSEATIMNHAGTWLGVKYVYGGNSRNGIDCSHLVYQVYRSAGIPYPYMTTSAMRTSSRFICVNPLPGDIILFMNINHCGIYAGNGWMIDANSSYGKVRYDYIWDPYWSAQRPIAIRFIG